MGDMRVGPLQRRVQFRERTRLDLADTFLGNAKLFAKRFQDCDKPGGLALIGIGLGIVQTLTRLLGLSNPMAPTAVDWILNILLLIVGIWYLIELGCLRGTVGKNRYGPDPLEGRWPDG